MIKSAAIIKPVALAPWRELRSQKRRQKKEQAAERKAIKQYFPSPIGFLPMEEPIEMMPPTREEMNEQAVKIGLKADKRWSDATLLKRINEAMTWDTANASS